MTMLFTWCLQSGKHELLKTGVINKYERRKIRSESDF